MSAAHYDDGNGTARRGALGAQDERLPPAVLTLRPIGNPLAMGLVGLAIASLVMSGHEFHWYGGGERLQVGLIIAIVAPLLQTTASVVAFQARDSVAATALGVQAATWLYTGVVIATTSPNSYSDVLGTALLASGAAVLATAMNAARFRGLIALVIGVTGTRWVLSGIAQLSASTSWEHAAGIVGFVVTALALLAASVGETEEETHQLLPVSMRKKQGEAVFHPTDYDHQQQAAVEPGVRGLL